MRAALAFVILVAMSGVGLAQQQAPTAVERQEFRQQTAANSPQGDGPSPDPTTLTTDALRREIASLKEILMGIIEGKFDVIEQRLDSGDKAVALLQEATDRQPERTRAAFEALKALIDEKLARQEEKFEGIQLQFAERDVRIEQAATATKIAVDAALQAAEKAVQAALVNASAVTAKSEDNFIKLIDGMSALIQTTASNTDGKIADLKDRLTAIESVKVGQSENWGFIFGAGGFFTAAGMALFALTRGSNIIRGKE